MTAMEIVHRLNNSFLFHAARDKFGVTVIRDVWFNGASTNWNTQKLCWFVTGPHIFIGRGPTYRDRGTLPLRRGATPDDAILTFWHQITTLSPVEWVAVGTGDDRGYYRHDSSTEMFMRLDPHELYALERASDA